MSGKLVGRIYDEIEIKRPMQIVLVAMADHAHDDGSKVFPSLDRIAWKTGYSVRQVQRIIGALKEMGVLKVVREGTKGRSTEYRIVLSKAPKKKPFNVWKAEQAKYPDKMSDSLDDILSDDDKMSLDSTDGSGDTGVANGVTSGCPPNHHVTVMNEGGSDEPPGAPPSGPSPRDIIEAFCAHTGVPDTAMSKKEYGIAKALIGKGMTPDRIPALYEYAKGDYIGRNGVDFPVMQAVYTKFLAWEAAEAKRPKSVFGDAFVRRK